MSDNFTAINIHDYTLGEESLLTLLSEFSCPKNPDVENFFCKNSIEFARKHQSVTYLVFDRNDAELVGYFTLAVKPITIRADILSNSARRKIERIGKLDEKSNTYTMAAYLIAQLGKNFSSGNDSRISGECLLQIAVETVRKAQHLVGGMVVFLEANDEEHLTSFYGHNGFVAFGTKVSNVKKSQLVQFFKIL